jgi:sulfur carrier protein
VARAPGRKIRGVTTVMIKVNGQDKPIDEGTTLAHLIEQHNLTPQKVAVELNRRLVRTEKYAETALKAGDEVEIVTFVGGG